MLVLTRKTGEAIIIGNSIRVTIQEIGQGRVKIGVEAPSSVRIDREEIRERKLHEEFHDAESVIPVLHNRITEQLPPDATPRPQSKLPNPQTSQRPTKPR